MTAARSAQFAKRWTEKNPRIRSRSNKRLSCGVQTGVWHETYWFSIGIRLRRGYGGLRPPTIGETGGDCRFHVGDFGVTGNPPTLRLPRIKEKARREGQSPPGGLGGGTKAIAVASCCRSCERSVLSRTMSTALASDCRSYRKLLLLWRLRRLRRWRLLLLLG
jgi:hypothetical protein